MGTLIYSRPGLEELRKQLESMILSASGWRAVFARSGDEESSESQVPDTLLVLAALAARVFGDHIKAETPQPVLAVGSDARPTGPAIQRAVIRTLIHCGVQVRVLGVCATPEIIAYANSDAQISGFFYISASHNPIGHNGLKMGRTPGGVLESAEAERLITTFHARLNEESVTELCRLLAGPALQSETSALQQQPQIKRNALSAYADFVNRTMIGPGIDAPTILADLKTSLREHRVTIIGDMNGSARAASIDQEFLSGIGCSARMINATVGEVVHQIVPEGPGLEQCRKEVEEYGRKTDGKQVVIGYVPDNDGDRGNLVYYDQRQKRAFPIDSQSVFALACVAELSWLKATGALNEPDQVAIVVNGPTSLRIDQIVRMFGVRVVRTEVGEANVISGSSMLRKDGLVVRILGEGSNGGTIIHPAAVRDPLNTIGAILKLLFCPGRTAESTPLMIWTQKLGESEKSIAPTIGAVLDSLPSFCTTSAYEERAIMQVGAVSQSILKARFEKRLEPEIGARLPILRKEAGIESWHVVNYEGITTRPGTGNRTGDESGGLKVLFCDGNGQECAFLWMRGSKTEPVFRVMADVAGDRGALESELLEWLRNMVETAARLDTDDPS